MFPSRSGTRPDIGGVHAAAVNFPDVLFVEGEYQVKIPPPFIPGNEIAGEVIAAGEGAANSPGQRVAGTRSERSPNRRYSTGLRRRSSR